MHGLNSILCQSYHRVQHILVSTFHVTGVVRLQIIDWLSKHGVGKQTPVWLRGMFPPSQPPLTMRQLLLAKQGQLVTIHGVVTGALPISKIV